MPHAKQAYEKVFFIVFMNEEMKTMVIMKKVYYKIRKKNMFSHVAQVKHRISPVHHQRSTTQQT